MIRTAKKLAVAAAVATALAGLATTTALAAADSDDSLSPASTSFTASNSGSVTFSVSILGTNVVVTCTSSLLTAKTPTSGLTLTLASPPAFSGCTDNHGGTETVTTSGTWKLVFVDAPNDESQAEPNSGGSLSLSTPAGGAKVTSSLLPSCPVTAAASTVTAAYNDTNTATFTNQKISGSACGISATANFSGKYLTSTNVTDSS
jgi:hypothetical protein